MPNIVIAYQDPLCQNAKNWLIKNRHAIEPATPADYHRLTDGDQMIVIAHDDQLKSGDPLLDHIRETAPQGLPNTKWTILLIVCSAASYEFGKELLTPAERIANTLKRTVYASKSLVYGAWNDEQGAKFSGEYITIQPGEDLTSLIKGLKIE